MCQRQRHTNKPACEWTERKFNVPGVSDDVCQCATLQVFHHDPQLVADQEAVVHVNNVWVVVVAHNYNLWRQQQTQQIINTHSDKGTKGI